MDSLYYLFGVLIFIATVLFIEGLYLTWNSAKGPEVSRVARRIQVFSGNGADEAQPISIIKQRALSNSPSLQRLLTRVPGIEAIDRLLQQSSLPWTVARFAMLTLLAFFVGFLVTGFFVSPILLRLSASAGLAALPTWYVQRAKQKRVELIEKQLPDALDLMVRAMRAGHAFSTALKMVCDEMPDPIRNEIFTIISEVNFGVSMPDALMNFATRVPSTDLRYFVIAVLIQRETGGNLSELLNNISFVVRERMKLHGHVKTLSAEGRMSAWILTGLPFGTALLIQIINPHFLQILYTDSAGKKMTTVAIVLMSLGQLFMRKIIKIRV